MRKSGVAEHPVQLASPERIQPGAPASFPNEIADRRKMGPGRLLSPLDAFRNGGKIRPMNVPDLGLDEDIRELALKEFKRF